MVNVENGALQSAIDRAAVGETVVLTSNIDLTNRVTVSNVITIDLNGYTITGNIDDAYGAIYVGVKGVLTIEDCSEEKSGAIINRVGNAIGNYGITHIYGGTFTGKYALYNFYYNNSVYGSSNIYGGSFKAVVEDSPAIANCGDLTVSGGSIDSIDTTNMLVLNGGAVDSLYVGTSDYNPEKECTVINGGNVTKLIVSNDSANKVSISGGTFACTVDSKYLADGAKFTYDEQTGTYKASVNHGLKVIATSSSRIRDLTIKDGQLIFLQDVGRIAFDFKGNRVFYNQIIELDTEESRTSLESPLSGYYFVIDSAILWFYKDKWIQITDKPHEIIFIGTELPALGQRDKLYIDTDDQEISVWDETLGRYIPVSNYTNEATDEDIENLFE